MGQDRRFSSHGRSKPSSLQCMDISNLGSAGDPFSANAAIDALADSANDKLKKKKKKDVDADAITGKAADLVHIRVQQRNGRKCITTVQGLSAELDLKKILKAL